MAESPAREPTFFIVGAAKAGTTSLAAYLGAHPDVFMAKRKELHYFDREKVYRRGWDWYLAQFAGVGDERAVGEATPSYMWRPLAVERIAERLPHSRHVALLRNPVDRAYSHYWHVRGYGKEKRSFEMAISDSAVEEHVGYLSRGRYAEQVRRLYTTFGRDSVHVLLFEDLADDRAGVFAGICRFLDVDPGVQPERLSEVLNTRHRVRSPKLHRKLRRYRVPGRFPRTARLIHRFNSTPATVPPMAADTRARLLESFRDPNAELAALLGRDLDVWSH